MSVAQRGGIAGLRVLIAEDELFCAMELEDMLDELECSVVGPVNTIAKILSSAKTPIARFWMSI